MQWRPKKIGEKTSQMQEQKPRHRQRRRNKSANGEGQSGKPGKLSRLHKPANMSLEDWQIELRRQFGRQQNFLLKNRGSERIFSEFEGGNPQS